MNRLFTKATPLIALVLLWASPVDAASKRSKNPLNRAKSSEVSSRDRRDARKNFERRVEALSRFALGISHELKGERDQALREFRKSVREDPSNQKLAADVARRLLAKREAKEAVSLLESAVRRKEPNAEMLAMLGLAYQQTKQPEKAIEACSTAIEKDPRAIVPYRVLVQSMMAEKKVDGALAVLHRAAAVEKTSVAFKVELADFIKGVIEPDPKLVEAHRDLLLQVLNQARAARPRTPVLIQRLAELFFYARDLKTSADLYLSLANRYPNSTAFRRRLVEIYLGNKDRKGAEVQLESILRGRPNDPQANFVLGQLAEEDREWDKAIDHYSKTKDAARGSAGIYYEIARLNLTKGDPDAALKVLDESASRFRESFSSEFYRALAFAQKKEYRTALSHYTGAELMAKQDSPQRLNHFFYFQFGISAERNQDFEQASRHFLKCLELKPDYADALNYLGYMWAERGEKLEQAKAMIEQAVAQEPENPAFLDSMGWVLYMMGNPRASLPWLLKSVESASVETEEDPTLFDHVADAYFAIGDYRNALKYYGFAVKVQAKPEIIDKLEETKKRLEPVPGG